MRLLFVTISDWAGIRNGAKKITCFAGDNDPYVPLAYSEDVAKNIPNAELIVIKDGGHLNTEFSYREFPSLLEKIQI